MMGLKRRMVVGLALICWTMGPAAGGYAADRGDSRVLAQAAEDAAVAPEDAAAFRSVISDQVAAFQNDDWERAFSHASPGIRGQFGSVERFRSMVLGGYRPVADPELFEFKEARLLAGRPAQIVHLVGPQGRSYRAVYFMELQPDGSWRISGVSLTVLPALST